MKLVIRTLESTLFSGKVSSVTLPGTVCPFQVLDNHAQIVSSLTKGTLMFVVDGEVRKMAMNGGFVEVQNNTISVYMYPVKKE